MCGALVFPAAVRIVVFQAFRILDSRCQPYDRKSREAMFGCSLEALNANEAEGRAGLTQALKPFDEVLAVRDYLGGPQPSYSDFLVFGIIKWAAIVSRYPVIDDSTPSGGWFERLQQGHGGYAASVPTVRAVANPA